MKHNIGFTHYQQMLSYAKWAENEGTYYGDHRVFLKRHQDILNFLNEAMGKCISRKNPESKNEK